MINFPVLSRLSGNVQFTAEIDCTEGDKSSVKMGLAVRWAIKNGANLGGANLGEANLGGANLVGAYLGEANLGGANLGGAYLGEANLGGANLGGAYLGEANLRGANLGGANLRGANLGGANGVNDWVKCIQIEQYPITYTSEVIQIGCERHTIDEWRGFDDRRIAEMDGREALKFWRNYKDWLFQTIDLCPAKPTLEREDSK